MVENYADNFVTERLGRSISQESTGIGIPELNSLMKRPTIIRFSSTFNQKQFVYLMVVAIYLIHRYRLDLQLNLLYKS